MPIKRNEFLRSVSREHHHSLLLCWKIRAGIKSKVDPERIKKYADWFFENHLLPHFETEEKYILPILGNEHKLVKKTLIEHQRLKYLFSFFDEIPNNIGLIEKELESHIRFEERMLFNEIQSIATDEQLQHIQLNHKDEKFTDNLTDPFWL
jgi:hypothetical protein